MICNLCLCFVFPLFLLCSALFLRERERERSFNVNLVSKINVMLVNKLFCGCFNLFFLIASLHCKGKNIAGREQPFLEMKHDALDRD